MRTRKHTVRVTTEPVRLSEETSVEVQRQAEEMWAWMWRPASSIDLLGAESAVTLPGTAEGAIGEIQVALFRLANGLAASAHQVVELIPGRRAVTRSLTNEYPVFAILSIDSLGPHSCRITQRYECELPAGIQDIYVDGMRETLRSTVHTIAQRLGELPADRTRLE
jgi:hypothetical protein